VQGSNGTQGANGVQGAQGLIGPQGVQGVQGPQGHQGRDGAQGYSGFQGLQGSNGTQGANGVQGAQGVPGSGFEPLLFAFATSLTPIINATFITDWTTNPDPYYSLTAFAAGVWTVPTTGFYNHTIVLNTSMVGISGQGVMSRPRFTLQRVSDNVDILHGLITLSSGIQSGRIGECTLAGVPRLTAGDQYRLLFDPSTLQFTGAPGTGIFLRESPTFVSTWAIHRIL
jgi:hypothetical protein